MPIRSLALLLATTLLCACSTLNSAVDALNPFSGSSSKSKAAPLVPFAPSAELRVLWQTSVGDAGVHTLVPAVVGNSVYAAASNGALARFDAGREAWRTTVGKAITGAVGGDGVHVAVGGPRGEIYLYDANGKPLWKGQLSSEVLAPPLVTAESVLVRSGDHRLHALSLANGERQWLYQRQTPPLALRATSGLTRANNTLLAGFPGGKLVAIDLKTGALLWETTVALPRGATELERVADVVGTPAVIGNDVCVVAYQGRAGCFDLSNGRPYWSRELSSLVGVAVDSRNVYIADDRGNVHALERSSGASVWRQDALAYRGLSRPIVVGDHVLVGDAEGVVHLLKRSNGSLAARLSLDGPIAADPQPFGDAVVLQTRRGSLYALAAR